MYRFATLFALLEIPLRIKAVGGDLFQLIHAAAAEAYRIPVVLFRLFDIFQLHVNISDAYI